MRVLVAGAGGYLGRAAVESCAKAGHDVRGLVRSPRQFSTVRSAGGLPVRGDLLEPRSLVGPVTGCDAVIHLAQSTSDSLAVRRKVRVQGGRNLLRAARDAGVARCVIGSGYWVYRDNPGVITEGSPLAPMSISKVNFEAEELVRSDRSKATIDSVVLRPGMVYGPGSWFAEMVNDLRAGRYEYIGDGSNYLSPVHLRDAGEAFRCALEKGRSGGVYLVADDEPVRTREFVDFVARHMKVPRARSIPYDRARRAWGPAMADLNRASRRVSNRKIRALGWKPLYRTFRRGVPAVLAGMSP